MTVPEDLTAEDKIALVRKYVSDNLEVWGEGGMSLLAIAYADISTHPRIFREPLSVDEALSNIHDLIDRPNIRTVGEGPRFWPRLNDVIADARPTGNLFPDAHLVGLMLENGVRTIWTHDRDFRRFRGIQARDPFA